jgi:hypothetical protein
MAENNLVGGINQLAGAQYPSFQPMQQPNPLTQVQPMLDVARSAQALQQQQFELGKQRALFVQDRLGSLATDPDLSIEKAQTMVADMVRNNIIPASEAPQILQHFPSDPQQLRKSIQQSYATTLDHVNKMNYVYGQPVSANTGGAIQFGVADQRNPGQPRFAGGTTLPNTMSPGEAATPETMVDAAGNKRQMTRGQALVEKGVNPQAPQLAGAFRQPAAPGQQGVAAPGATFGPSLEAYNTDMRASSDLAKTIRTSGQALQLADALGTTGTGPGTKPFNDAKAFLESVGITAPNDAVSMRNELDKYLQQTVNNSPLAQRSDMGTLATKLGTPNTTEQTNAATRQLLRTGIAQAGMDAAVPHAYDWHGNGGSVAGYIQHKGGFTQNQDQQAYALAQGLMKPDEAKTLLDKMNALPNSSAQKQKFFTSLANAKKAGLVNLPNASGQ